MKSNLSFKLLIALCLCAVIALTFVACKDKEIYADSSDFESYPDYWNDFNDDHGDLYVPDNSSTVSGDDKDDWTANNTDEDAEDPTDKIDTDGDGTPNKKDPDIDGDGTDNKDDPDVDGDGVENEKDPDIDGDDIPNENDPDKDGANNSDKNEGPFVPFG